MISLSITDNLWVCMFLTQALLSLCSSQVSVMTNERTKVKFSWLRTAFVSPTKFQKNDVGLARPTHWGDGASDDSSKDSTPSRNMSTSSVGPGVLENMRLGTPQGRRVTPSQTQSTPNTHHMSSRLFKNAKVNV